MYKESALYYLSGFFSVGYTHSVWGTFVVLVVKSWPDQFRAKDLTHCANSSAQPSIFLTSKNELVSGGKMASHKYSRGLDSSKG